MTQPTSNTIPSSVPTGDLMSLHAMVTAHQQRDIAPDLTSLTRRNSHLNAMLGDLADTFLQRNFDEIHRLPPGMTEHEHLDFIAEAEEADYNADNGTAAGYNERRNCIVCHGLHLYRAPCPDCPGDRIYLPHLRSYACPTCQGRRHIVYRCACHPANIQHGFANCQTCARPATETRLASARVSPGQVTALLTRHEMVRSERWIYHYRQLLARRQQGADTGPHIPATGTGSWPPVVDIDRYPILIHDRRNGSLRFHDPNQPGA